MRRLPTVGVMCTLILGWSVVGDKSLLLAANRDESPLRPSERPRVLRHGPRLVGGRDLWAGGTWLALRAGRCAVGVLNRRPPVDLSAGPGAGPVPSPKPPSRGLLALAVAAAGDGSPAGAAAAALLLLAADSYAPCSLVVAGPAAAFVVNHRAPGETSVETLAPGWHVITHEDVDDSREPRTAWLAGELRDFRPHSEDDGLARLGELLARHDGDGPAVCLHEGRMVTVSTIRVAMSAEATRYFHGEGPACSASLIDCSHLLEDS
ncbi:MAG: NRDE family protein [Candidatus Eisenbacteria bacterium]